MTRSRFVSRTAAVAMTMVAIVAACSGSASTDPTVIPGTLGPGKWGSPTAGLEITDSTGLVRFEFCATGTLTVPVLLTSDGRFDVPGTYIRNIGPSVQAKSARYVGLWRPRSLTLTVFLSDPIGPNTSDVVGPFDLDLDGAGPPERPCPL
jgi:hypothetical protein